MGCHTWFYKNENRSIEQARALYIKDKERFINALIRMVNDPLDETRVALNWDQEILEKGLKINQRQLRMVEAGLCNVAVMNKQKSADNKTTCYIDGRGFYVSTEFHDLFRIGGYPDIRLFSKKECLDFIKLNKDKIQLFENTYEKLDQFWEKYPDGMVEFG